MPVFAAPPPPPSPNYLPPELKGDVDPSEFVPIYWGPPRREGLWCQFGHFWAPEKARVMSPLLILSPFIRDLREGKGDVTPCDFVPFYWGPPEGRGYVAIPPTCGPPRRQGLSSQLLSDKGSRSTYAMRFSGHVLRKYLRRTQGRPDLCFGGFSTYGEPRCWIQLSGAIEETGPIELNLLW